MQATPKAFPFQTGRCRLSLGKALITTALVIGSAAQSATTETYPTRSITIIVPSAAGGPTDALTRVLADYMRGFLEQSIVIENQGTAGGTVAVGRVARAQPDGYTLSIGQWGNFVINGAVYPLQYDLLRDFAPISLLATNPQLIVGRTSLPVANLKDLIAWLRKNPGKATQGTAGAGSPAHVGGLYFQQLTGTQFQFVPYRGAAPAMLDLLAGRIDLLFDQASNSVPQVRGGKIKAFAVAAKRRLSDAPDIPTVDEAGLPGFQVSVWHGMWAPKGTSQAVITKLNSAVRAALSDPHVQQRLAKLGQQIPTRDQQTPAALAALQRSEAEKWWPIIKAANIQPGH